MKTKLFLLALVATAIISCKPKDNPQPTPEPLTLDILGTWRTVQTNGAETCTNDRQIISYISSSKKITSLSRFIPEFGEFTWRNKALGSYSLVGDSLIQDAADPGTTDICLAKALTAETMQVDYRFFVTKSGEVKKGSDVLVYERVPENLQYDELIIGLWEGVSHWGEQTYGDHHHRWEYKPVDRSGFYTYDYYNYDSLQGVWVKQINSTSDYNVHGSWLATRWDNLGDPTLNYEWWDIDQITDSTMQWSALRMRPDSSGTFRAYFTFRRVVED